MNKQKVLVAILSIINLAWLGLSLKVLASNPSTGCMMLIPLTIGLIIFFILKKVKKFETIRALKYANLYGIVPFGILGLLYFFVNFYPSSKAGDLVEPIDYREKCMQICQKKTKKISNATQDCIVACLEYLSSK